MFSAMSMHNIQIIAVVKYIMPGNHFQVIMSVIMFM